MANLKVGVDITSDGYTFLAITMGSYGTWTIGLNLQEVIARANRTASSDRTNVIEVWYGKSDDMNVGPMGGLLWKNNNPPIPVGLFAAKKNTISFLKPNEVYKMFKGAPKDSYHDWLHHENWLKDQVGMFEKHGTKTDEGGDHGDHWLGKNFKEE